MLGMLVGLVVAGCGLTAQAQPGGMMGESDSRSDDVRERREMRGRPATLAVTGRGEVKASPDTAVVRLGATHQAEEAQAAQDAVNRVVRAALERIKEAGVDEAQIQTAGVSLHPVYDHGGPRDQPREPRVVGYRASNTLRIEVRDLTKVGDVIDGAVEAGANELQGLDYELREDGEAKAGALTRAVEKARSEAETVAQALGLSLRGVERVEVGEVGHRPPMPMARGMVMAEAAMAPTPTEPGQVQVDAMVTIVYRLSGGPTDDRDRRGGVGGGRGDGEDERDVEERMRQRRDRGAGGEAQP